MKKAAGKLRKYQYADFYVAENGCDGWSGTLPEPNRDGTDGPFATVERARDAVRAIKNGLYRDIFVLIRGGEYRLHKTVVFRGCDGHHESYRIVYAAYPGETPVFSSDIPVTGWKIAQEVPGLPESSRGKVYEAPLPKLPAGKKRIYTLYANGKRLTRAHSKGFEPCYPIPANADLPDISGLLRSDRRTIFCPPGFLRGWENPEDIEIFAEPGVGYVTNYLPLCRVDANAGTAETSIPSTYPVGRVDKHLFAMGSGSCRLENAVDFLTEPGSWAVDTRRGKLYYYPENGTPEHVAAPALTEYFRVDGYERGELVKGIVFEGLTFTRADRDAVTQDDIGLQHDWDLWDKGNAMVRFRGAEDCALRGCRLCESGSGGVRLDLHCQSNRVENNLIDHVGGTGVLLCGFGPGRVNENRCNRIRNNHIHHCGELYYHASGIMVWQSSENLIKNNLLHHLPYDSIVLSGVRPYCFNAKEPNREMEGTIRRSEIPPESQLCAIQTTEELHAQWRKIAPFYQTRNNIVEENEMFLTMQRMFDGNAIYLSDVGGGNLIRRNFIHHLNGIGMQQGIRTDAFLKDTMITENIVYNVTGGGINTKYYENHVVNNIVADVRDIVYENSPGEEKRMFIGYISLLDVYERAKMPPNACLRVERNLFYKTAAHQPFYRESVVDGRLTQVHLEEAEIDRNLYFDEAAPDGGASRLAYQQSRGADAHSLARDPLFVDMRRGDFRLREGSPALLVGFESFPLDGFGLTSEFPAVYDAIVRGELGEDYDDFEKLERLCAPAESSGLRQEILDNV